MKPAHTGLARLGRATIYSMRGLRAAWQGEAAFRLECLAAVVLVPSAFILAETLVQAALPIASIGLVLVVELLNSAIEAAVDRIGNEHHVLAGRAKDLGSAAVFVSLSIAIVTWALVAAERFL